MKVFVSYSVEDTSLVRQLVAQLRSCTDKVFWWDGNKEPGQGVWLTIHDWIDQSDLVLAVLTGRTLARAMAVGNEIGYARAKGKFILPLVGPEVRSEELGCLSGVTYERINSENPGPAIEAVRLQIATREQQAADKALNLLLIVGGVIAMIWLLLKAREPGEDDGHSDA